MPIHHSLIVLKGKKLGAHYIHNRSQDIEYERNK